jgi:3-hydroxybutyryl-CoA dehydratase
MTRARPGDRFSKEVRLTPEAVSKFAREAGDANPVHHDDEHARGTRFGELIASGPQTSALLMGLTASHFSAGGAMLGLDFSFRFKRAVPASGTVRLEWLVVRVRASERLGGEVVDLRGRLQNEDGATAVGASARVLLLDRL